MAEVAREAMMKAWEGAGRSGEKHELLGRLVGTWDISTRSWMETPKGPAALPKGVVETRWLIPGRWVIDEVKSEMFGQPFQGFGLTVYDNVKVFEIRDDSTRPEGTKILESEHTRRW